MFRYPALFLFLALPGLAGAQEIDERTAPFKQSGALDNRLYTDTANDGTFAPVETEDVTEELLESARVVDATGNRIGPITGLVYDAGNRLSDVVVDVGGFIGIGQKPVRVALDAVAIGRSEEYGEVRMILPYSESELGEMEAFPVE